MPIKQINGVNLYYELDGDEKSESSIFFLNGVMASTGSWSQMLPSFRQAGVKIVLHDFRGQLKSDKPDRPWSFDDHVEDLICLMDLLEIEKSVFIGTSYGGEVALYFAAKYPDRCSALALIDSVSELTPLLEASVKSWIIAAEGGNGENFYRLMMPWLFSSGYLKKNSDFLEERAREMKNVPEDYFRGQADLYRTFLDVNITSELHKITAPSLILCGANDILKPPAFSEIIAANIPSSELVIIPDCGHVAIFEKAEELNNHILDFLNRKGIIRT